MILTEQPTIKPNSNNNVTHINFNMFYSTGNIFTIITILLILACNNCDSTLALWTSYNFLIHKRCFYLQIYKYEKCVEVMTCT